MEGPEDYATVDAKLIGEDEAGKVMADGKGHFVNFALPEGTKAQFLRIAATCMVGDNTPEDPEDYDSYSEPTDKNYSIRELFVFGTLTDEVKTPWMDPADDPYLKEDEENPGGNSENPGENPGDDNPGENPGGDSGDDGKNPPQPVATDDETEAPDVGTEPDTGGTDVGDEKGGCASSLACGSGMAVLLLGAFGTAMAGKRRKK